MRSLGDNETAARAALHLARGTWTRGEPEAVAPWMALVDELIGDVPDSVVYAEALVVRAAFHMVTGSYPEAISTIEQALPLVPGVDRPDLLARSYDIRGCSRCALGDKDGLADQQRAIELAKASRSMWEMHHAVNNLSVSYAGFAMLVEAEELLDEWGRLFDELGGTQFSQVWYFVAQADTCYERGRWDEALAFCDRFLATLPPGETHVIEPGARALRGEILFARGDTEAGFAELDRAVHGTEGDVQVYGSALTSRGLALLHAGRRAEAAQTLDELISLGQTPFVFIKTSSSLTDFVWLATALGRQDEVLRMLEGDTDDRWVKPARAILTGDYAAAADLLGAAGDLRAEADMRLRAGGAHLHAALEFYRSVGATRFVREAEALLGASA